MALGNCYPKLDLRDEQVRREQYENAARFRAKWRRVIFGFLGTFALFFIGGELVRPDQEEWLVLAIFLVIFATVISMLFYKCPKCGTVPSGVAYSVTANTASYSKGIHPFPKRCAGCGYYLSKRELEKVLKELS